MTDKSDEPAGRGKAARHAGKTAPAADGDAAARPFVEHHLEQAGLGLGGNESYPDLFQPFGGFPDGVKVENGYITMPDLPGIGFEGKADLIEVMRKLPD